IPARIFGVLGPLLLVLVAVGIYAVASYSVALRRKEIGTRLALGATAGQVIRRLVLGTLQLVAYGMAGGAAAALMIGRNAPGSAELVLLISVAVMFLAAATGATGLSARHVSGINPIAV